jgi:hypothetical protein
MWARTAVLVGLIGLVSVTAHNLGGKSVHSRGKT